jgi:hypothetical protein
LISRDQLLNVISAHQLQPAIKDIKEEVKENVKQFSRFIGEVPNP